MPLVLPYMVESQSICLTLSALAWASLAPLEPNDRNERFYGLPETMGKIVCTCHFLGKGLNLLLRRLKCGL